MIAIDTNVLIYAHREETPHHQAAYPALNRVATAKQSFGLPVFCLAEFLRIVT